jgi:hypothetical protein
MIGVAVAYFTYRGGFISSTPARLTMSAGSLPCLCQFAQ